MFENITVKPTCLKFKPQNILKMANEEKIIKRIREALAGVPTTEKKMFGRVAFMVNGKMCVTAGGDKIMCRIDPAFYEKALTKNGSSPMIMKGREYKGYVHIDISGIRTKKDLNYWISLALDFNRKIVDLKSGK